MTNSAIHNNPIPLPSPKKHTKEQLLQIVEQTLKNHPKLTKQPKDKFKLGINKNLIHSYYSLKVIVMVGQELKEITKSRNRGISILNTPDEWITLQMYPNFNDIWVCNIPSTLNKQEIEKRIHEWIESKQRALFFLT